MMVDYLVDKMGVALVEMMAEMMAETMAVS